MRKIVLAFLVALSTASPVQAQSGNDGGKGNSSNKGRGPTTSTAVTSPENSGSKGKSDSAGSTGKSGSEGSSVPGKTSSDVPKDKSEGSQSNKPTDAVESDTAVGSKNNSSDEESDDADANSGDSAKTYIVRFAAGVRPDEAGKSLIDNYNNDVKKANAVTRAAVKVRKASQVSSSTAAAKPLTVKLKESGSFVFSFKKVLNAAVIRIPESAVAGLLRNPKVLSIEKDASVNADPTPVDQSGALWGLDRIDQRALPLNNSFASPSNGAGVSI